MVASLTACSYPSVTDSINQPSKSEPSSSTRVVNKTPEAKKPTLPPKRIEKAEVTVYGLGEAGTGNTTATGDIFNPHTDLTAATSFGASKEQDPKGIKTQYPLGTLLKITDPKSGKSVDVRVNDKGNFGEHGEYNKQANFDVTPAVLKALGIEGTEGTNLLIEVTSFPNN